MKRTLAFSLLTLALACEAEPFFPPGGPDEPTPPTDGNFVFDDSVAHEINIEISSDSLGKLQFGNRERVPCAFTFDGVRLESVGIRLKGNRSFRDMSGKAQFSVKFDQFI